MVGPVFFSLGDPLSAAHCVVRLAVGPPGVFPWALLLAHAVLCFVVVVPAWWAPYFSLYPPFSLSVARCVGCLAVGVLEIADCAISAFCAFGCSSRVIFAFAPGFLRCVPCSFGLVLGFVPVLASQSVIFDLGSHPPQCAVFVSCIVCHALRRA